MLVAMYEELGIEIEGTAEDLRQFSQEIRECAGACRKVLRDSAEVDWRGLRYAKTITILIDAGPVNIIRVEDDIVISGSTDRLLILAQNFSFLADHVKSGPPNKIRDHIHIDYHPDHYFLAESALPIIVTKL